MKNILRKNLNLKIINLQKKLFKTVLKTLGLIIGAPYFNSNDIQ